jgi:hypothetical protein
VQGGSEQSVQLRMVTKNGTNCHRCSVMVTCIGCAAHTGERARHIDQDSCQSSHRCVMPEDDELFSTEGAAALAMDSVEGQPPVFDLTELGVPCVSRRRRIPADGRATGGR